MGCMACQGSKKPQQQLQSGQLLRELLQRDQEQRQKQKELKPKEDKQLRQEKQPQENITQKTIGQKRIQIDNQFQPQKPGANRIWKQQDIQRQNGVSQGMKRPQIYVDEELDIDKIEDQFRQIEEKEHIEPYLPDFIRPLSEQDQLAYKKISELEQNSKKSIILTGYIGSGKTTLFNKICKENQKATAGGESITQDVFSKQSAYGKGFRVLDTPGLGVNSKKMAHACAIMCGLTEGPLNMILITIKAERTDLMSRQLKPIIVQYTRFKNLISVAVTHWDVIRNQDLISDSEIAKIKQGILNMIKDFNVHSVFFVEIKTKGEELCEQINNILKRNNAQEVVLTSAEFFKNFDLFEIPDEIQDRLNNAKEQVTKIFLKISNAIKIFIQKYPPDNKDMPEVMHFLTIEIKNFAIKTITNFEKQNNEEFSQLYLQCDDLNIAYFIHIELKKELMNQVNQLVLLAQKKMKVSESHCFNFIKKCPHCGTIWFKVSGCKGRTMCGGFPEEDDDKFQNDVIPQRFAFRFTEREVKFKRLSIQQIPNKKKYQNPKQQIGCGEKFDWEKIPPLEPYLVTELLDPGVLDYFADQLKQQYDKEKNKAKVHYLDQKV